MRWPLRHLTKSICKETLCSMVPQTLASTVGVSTDRLRWTISNTVTDLFILQTMCFIRLYTLRVRTFVAPFMLAVVLLWPFPAWRLDFYRWHKMLPFSGRCRYTATPAVSSKLCIFNRALVIEFLCSSSRTRRAWKVDPQSGADFKSIAVDQSWCPLLWWNHWRSFLCSLSHCSG